MSWSLTPTPNPKGRCAAKGSEAVIEAIKLAAHAAGLTGQARVNTALCLDACEHGVSAVVPPQGRWYRGIVATNADELVQRTLLRGDVVERLVLEPAPPAVARSSTARRPTSS